MVRSRRDVLSRCEAFRIVGLVRRMWSARMGRAWIGSWSQFILVAGLTRSLGRCIMPWRGCGTGLPVVVGFPFPHASDKSSQLRRLGGAFASIGKLMDFGAGRLVIGHRIDLHRGSSLAIKPQGSPEFRLFVSNGAEPFSASRVKCPPKGRLAIEEPVCFAIGMLAVAVMAWYASELWDV